MEKLDRNILKLLYRNAKLNAEDIAVLLGEDVNLIAVKMEEMEQQGYIRGYKAVVDWDKTDSTYVSAIIQLKVTPKAGLGFEEIAEKVMKQFEALYPEKIPEFESYNRNVGVEARFAESDWDQKVDLGYINRQSGQ